MDDKTKSRIRFLIPSFILIVQTISASPDSKLSWTRHRNRYLDSYINDKSQHVCVLEEVRGQPHRKFYSECMSSVPSYICGKPTFLRYHCCTGYNQEHVKSEGCFVVKPTVNLENTVKNFYLIELEKHLEKVGDKTRKLLTQTNSTITLFAPQNKAFEKLSKDKKRQLMDPSNNLMLLHMSNLRLPTSQLQNNKNVSTLYGQNLHIHRYGNGIITVNCVRVMLPNQPATNGIVHVMEDIIKPIEDNADLMQLLSRTKNAKLFVAALRSTGVDKKLDLNNHHTVILPTDEAILKLGKRWDRIKKNPELLKKFVQYHIIDCCICSSAILGPYHPTSLEGEKIRFNCNINDTISFNDIDAIDLDRVATNGIVHTIDEALIPDSVLTVEEKLELLGHEVFLNFSEEVGMKGALGANNFITVFVPSDEVFNKANETDQKQWLNGKKEVRTMVGSHIVEGDYSTQTLVGLESVQAGLGPQKTALDINMHANIFFVNNAKIIKPDIRVSNGIIHVVNAIVEPKVEKIAATLKDSPDVSNFTEFLKTVNINSIEPGRKRTIFVPNDEAFRSMKPDQLAALKKQKDKLAEFIRRHTVSSLIYPVSLEPQLINRFKTLGSDVISIIKRANGKGRKDSGIVINQNVNVVRHHTNNVDGVLYVIDKIL